MNSCPICFFPVASPHFGKNTWASSANRSMTVPPLEVTPLLSNAFRYSSATDFRCSSVIDPRVIAIVRSLSLNCSRAVSLTHDRSLDHPHALSTPKSQLPKPDHLGIGSWRLGVVGVLTACVRNY